MVIFMKSKSITIIPIPQCYCYQLFSYPSVYKYIKRCDDIDCYYVEQSSLNDFIYELNLLLEFHDDDLCLYLFIHSLFDDINITLEEDACLVINQF